MGLTTRSACYVATQRPTFATSGRFLVEASTGQPRPNNATQAKRGATRHGQRRDLLQAIEPCSMALCDPGLGWGLLAGGKQFELK